ncbi:MAG: chromosome partitioning protein ParA [Verrucomicrobiaceae bacterium]|nr:chromosome partitioning protein ParA [Verrucomicrobiaceae bacterium]
MQQKKSIGAAALILSVGLVLTACSSTPIPTAEIAVSKTAVASAVSAGGGEFAPLELKLAQDKVDQADKAVDRKDYKEARRLSQEAAVDAKLAESKALAGKTEKSVKETQEAQQALKEEMQRQTP